MIFTIEIHARKSNSTSGSRLSSFETECRHIIMIIVSRRPHVAARTVASRIFATKTMKRQKIRRLKIYENRHKQQFRNDPAKNVSHGDNLTLDVSLVDTEFAKLMELHQKRASQPITLANQLEDHHRGLFRWNVSYVLCFQTGVRIVSTSMKI